MRKVIFRLVLLVVALSGTSALAETLSCDVYMGLNRYHVVTTVDTESLMMSVKLENGNSYSGIANYADVVSRGRQRFYLQSSFAQGFEFVVDEQTGNWLCIKENECYLCR